MNINGKNGLACLTNMRDAAGHRRAQAAAGLPVVRDLIVDMTQFFKQYNSIKPYLVNDTPPPEKERLQSPRSARSSTACTSASCAPAAHQLPQLLVEPRQVRRPGRPAAGLPLHCRQPRPGHRRRLDNLEDPYRLFRCHTIMNCVDVCPKGLNPTKAIGKIKELMVRRAV
jgi:succinate dehydrogenase / fumarate reductase iron-sulfur subunit